MTVHTQIRKSEDNFKLAQQICKLFSEHYSKDEEEVWGVLSPNHSVTKIQKRFKKQRKANDPLSSVKKPRTAYSFFTQDKRQSIQDEHPNVAFGELSKLVAKAWKKLSDTQMAKYKKKETEDKDRYATEKAAVLAELERNPPAPTPAPAPVQTEEELPTPVAKPTRKAASKAKTVAKTTETVVTAPAKSTKSTTSKGKRTGTGKVKRTAATTTAATVTA